MERNLNCDSFSSQSQLSKSGILYRELSTDNSVTKAWDFMKNVFTVSQINLLKTKVICNKENNR